MDSDELIKFMKDLIYSYEYINDPLNPSGAEIRMWRERFLSSQTKIENIEKSALEWSIFLATTSRTIMEKGPENAFKRIRDGVESL